MKNILEARTRFKALGTDEQAIVSQRHCEGTRTPTEWLRLIDRLIDFDRFAERTRRGVRGFFWITLVCAFVALIVGVNSGNSLVLAVAGLAALAAFAFLLPNWLWLRSVDVPDSLHHYAAPLIAILREDMKPEAGLTCVLDFSEGDAKAKEVRAVKVPKADLPSRTVSRTNFLYRNPWLTLEGPLVDGSRLRFEITDFHHVAKVTKRSRSGKIKRKSKVKLKRISRVTLRPGDGLSVTATPSPLIEIAARSDGSQSIRARKIEAFPSSIAAATPEPNLDHFIALTGLAMQGITRVAHP